MYEHIQYSRLIWITIILLSIIIIMGISLSIKLEKDNAKSYKINPLVVTTIRNYVHTKYQVIRMVVLGNILQKLMENN